MKMRLLPSCHSLGVMRFNTSFCCIDLNSATALIACVTFGDRAHLILRVV